ncbi:MAG TPA: hypothetical protein VGA18_04010 [Rhodothermales bacterium]
MRNSVFEGTTSFGGMDVRDAEMFESIEIVNNTLRTSQTVPGTPAQYAVGFSTDVAVFSGPLPVLFVNNVLMGNGGDAFAIPINTTIDSDYNLIHAFANNYTGGSSSTGTNDLFGNPDFIDGELRVSAISPAVDSGATSAQIAAVLGDDFSAGPRPVGVGVDRGAHER